MLRRLRLWDLNGIVVALLAMAFLAGSAPLMLGFIVVKSPAGPEIMADVCHPAQSASRASLYASPLPAARQEFRRLPQAGFVDDAAAPRIDEPCEPPASPPPKLAA